MKKIFTLSVFLFAAVLTASAQLSDILLPTVNPASGSTVESLKNVTLTFDVDYVSWGYDAISVTDAAGATVTQVYVNSDIMNTNVANVILADEITTPGTYSINFPEGYFYETKEDFYTTTGKASPALTLTYTVETPKDVLDFTADPANGSTVDQLDKVLLCFETDMIDGLAGYGAADQYGAGAQQVTVYGAYGDSITNIVWKYDADYTKIVLNLASAITTPGTYYFTLPEGYVWEYDDTYAATGRKTRETTFTYTVSAPATLAFTADPASGSTVQELSKITLTFPTNMVTGASKYASDAQYSYFGEQVPVCDASGTQVAGLVWNYGTSDYDLVLTLSPAITEEGTYTIVLPKGFAIELDASWNEVQITPESTLTYTISAATGIQKIEGGESKAAIYNLAGQRVNRTQRGVYVINGKKVLK